MTWRKGVVVKHVQHHENYDVRGDDNPPWTRTVRFEDGREQTFTWSELYRDGTYGGNTQVGAEVWVSDRGGISAKPPRPQDIT